jgi:hypothetical protein
MTIWLMAIPYGIGGISEIFVNVPAYGIAYSRAPVSMRGLVSAINLFNTGVAYAIGLACSSVIRDPYLTWDFGGCAIAGFITCAIFYVMFRKIDKEELVIREESAVDYHLDSTGTRSVVRANSINDTHVEVPEITKNEEVMISQKQ